MRKYVNDIDIMNTTFEGEIEFICRRIAMCDKWENGCCNGSLSPESCPRALKSVKKLNDRLVLGNSGSNRMLFEEIRVCRDLKWFI